MELTYFGHSAFQVKTKDVTLLFDPYIKGNPIAEQVVSVEDLNPDVIMITHAHFDHWGDTPEIAKRSGALVVTNFDIIEYLKREHDYARGHSMNTGGCWTFDWGTVHQTYARHSSSFPDGTYGGNPNGYILYVEGKCLYNLGDTSPFSEMTWIGEDHDIDVALMPIGDCFTMGISGAVRAAGLLKPKLSIPLHYDTFPPIEVDVEEWAERMEADGSPAKVLKPGETISI